MRLYMLLPLLMLVNACSGQNGSDGDLASKPNNVGYSFNKPSQVYELPEELEEISGLATLSDTRLLCNEDETGTLYVFDLNKSKVDKKVKWGKKGDYEGVTILDGKIYILKSNGTIYELDNLDDSQPIEIETGMWKGCDAEGLTFIPGRKSLLIACKEGDADTRNFYEYEMENGKLTEEPYLQIPLKEIEQFFVNTGLDELSLQLRKMLDPKGGSGVFFPSGLAFHPLTGDLYVLSSKSKLMLVFSKGVFKEAIELHPEIYPQPEAITFLPNGDLFIGNEGKNGMANIIKVVYDQP